MPVLSAFGSMLHASIAWWRDHMQDVFPAQRASRDLRALDAEMLSVPRYYYDASLLFERLALLRIDRDGLAREDPLLLRELEGICALCGSKRECMQDLARECETGEPQDWQDYCLNVATLNALGSLENCPRAAARHQGMPVDPTRTCRVLKIV